MTKLYLQYLWNSVSIVYYKVRIGILVWQIKRLKNECNKIRRELGLDD